MTPEELKEWRASLKMTQREFSRFLKPERTETQVSRYENGSANIPEWIETQKRMVELGSE